MAELSYYQKIRILGQGAFGVAYLVVHSETQVKYVQKELDLSAMTQKEKDTTIKEAMILKNLNHPNIVKFQDVYVLKQKTLCIVMEHADGGDLSERTKQQKGKYFPESQILDWFTQICLALKHVHDRKLIHRDLKGQNLFLTKNNRIKLGDFGIARQLMSTWDKARTQIGTPYYLSPEIVNSKPYSYSSDIWSLGVILYELCALKPPFLADSIAALALRIMEGRYPPIPQHFSPEMKGLLSKLLQTDPQKRPSVNQILKMPIITNRIKNLLTESVQKLEFAHTILHKQKLQLNYKLEDIQQKDDFLQEPPPALLQRNLSQPEQAPKNQNQLAKVQSEQPRQAQPLQAQVKSQQPQKVESNGNNQQAHKMVVRPQGVQDRQQYQPPKIQMQNPAPTKGVSKSDSTKPQPQLQPSQSKPGQKSMAEQKLEREKQEQLLKQKQLQAKQEAEQKKKEKELQIKQQQQELEKQRKLEKKKIRDLERQRMYEDMRMRKQQAARGKTKLEGGEEQKIEQIENQQALNEGYELPEYNSDEDIDVQNAVEQQPEEQVQVDQVQGPTIDAPEQGPAMDFGVNCEDEEQISVGEAEQFQELEKILNDEELADNEELERQFQFEKQRQLILTNELVIADVDELVGLDQSLTSLSITNESELKNALQSIKLNGGLIKLKAELEAQIGAENLEKAAKIFYDLLIEQKRTIEDIETENRKTHFQQLLPFLNMEQIKQALENIILYTISRDWKKR